jgi:predicted MFS family arabinose efflux permease
VFGIATGVSSPTLFAWTADLSAPTRRGVGAGTIFIALEVGIMAGSFMTIGTYNSTIDTVMLTFLIGVFASLMAITYLIWHLRFRESAT